MLRSCTLESSESTSHVHRLLLLSACVERWLLLHASEHVRLGCLAKCVVLLWRLLLLLGIARVKGGLPLVGSLVLLLLHTAKLLSIHVVGLLLLLLLEGAIEELGLETALCSRLLWCTHVSSEWIRLGLRLLRRCLVLQHLHLLHLRLALLLLIVEVGHDFESCVFLGLDVSLWVLAHHCHDVVYLHLLLVLYWLLLLSLCWSRKVSEAIILLWLILRCWSGGDEVAKLVIIRGSSHADEIRSRLSCLLWSGRGCSSSS